MLAKYLMLDDWYEREWLLLPGFLCNIQQSCRGLRCLLKRKWDIREDNVLLVAFLVDKESMAGVCRLGWQHGLHLWCGLVGWWQLSMAWRVVLKPGQSQPTSEAIGRLGNSPTVTSQLSCWWPRQTLVAGTSLMSPCIHVTKRETPS